MRSLRIRHCSKKHHKFAYSSAFAFSVRHDHVNLESLAPDSTLALSDDDGEHWWIREKNVETQTEGQVLYARWEPWKDVSIETWLVPVAGGGHILRHRNSGA